jgi:hypothetical protein
MENTSTTMTTRNSASENRNLAIGCGVVALVIMVLLGGCGTVIYFGVPAAAHWVGGIAGSVIHGFTDAAGN